MYKMRLSESVEGDYWICENPADEKTRLVNIRSYKGKWIASSSKYSKVINPRYIRNENGGISIIPSSSAVVKAAVLKEYSKIYISIKNHEEVYVLYCFPSYEKEIRTFEPANTEETITIGSDISNDIIGKDNHLNTVHAQIFLGNNGYWYIENLDEKFGTYVNNESVENETQILKNGDIIFIAGIKIMILGNTFSIYGPEENVKVSHRNMKTVIRNNRIPDIKSDKETEDEIELYKESDYFYRAPRINEKIESEDVHIDQPPKKEGAEKDSTAFLNILTTIITSMVSLVTIITTITSLQDGSIAGKNAYKRLATIVVMFLSVLILPFIRVFIMKRQAKKKESKRQIEYKRYINSNIMKINNIMEKQTKILRKENMSAEQCERVILEKSPELWERRITDNDFLNVNVGNGNRPLELGISKVEDRFSMEKDNLLDIYHDVADKSRVLENVPITTSLAEKTVISVISKDEKKIDDYMQSLIIQLIALHSYTDLKLVFFVKDEEKWDYVKMLPHIWDNTKKIRFFGNRANDIKEISAFLEDVMNERLATDDNGLISISRKEKDYKCFDPYYLIITDNYKNLHNVRIINRILSNQTNIGLSLLCITDDITQLPNECQEFIELDGSVCKMYENEKSSTTKKEFTLEKFEEFDYDKIAKVISNIPIKVASAKATALPDRYNFLEMYNSGNIEQLNIFDRWNTNDSTASLQALIGVDPSGNQIYLDAHEKYHGPHGLIAGTTGSGKSEFIITYVLSLAVNYHPDDVTFVLIDYKGGGLAGAFKKQNIQLPHLVGTITNIDSVGLQRSLESIQSELKRRQIMFNEAKNITNESTIDIYKYQKFYHDGMLKKPISHLFIICDEFAELKQQQPEFMSELMSVSRIGRSLGVHLILATQKPAGIVNDQIRSNSKFGVCLKVQDRSDSKDIIKKPDAATLKNAGQFYINVGNDEYFALGQSGYTGVPYIPSDTVKKEEDDSVAFISDIGNIIKKIEKKKEVKKTEANGDQLTNIVKYLSELAKRKEIKEKQLWLDPIPENIFVNNLRKKYGIVSQRNEIQPIIGEYDDPSNQLQSILTLDISKDGNTVIYGSADSGKELILSSIIYDTSIAHSPEEVQFYCLDFGSETLRAYKEFPQVGDVILSDDSEKISRLFTWMKEMIRARKKALVEYNGDYHMYLKTSDQPMPLTVIMINDTANFIQTYPEYENDIVQLSKEGFKYGIVFILTGNSVNDVKMRISQNFKKKISLQLIGGDYSYVFSKARRKKPSSIYGRGLTTVGDGDEVYEFQSSKICEPEKLNTYLKEFIKKLKLKYTTSAKPIAVMPKKIELSDVAESLTGIDNVPIGINCKNLKPNVYDFKSNLMSIITCKDIEEISGFIKALLEQLNTLQDTKLMLIDEYGIIRKQQGDFVERFNSFTIRVNQNMENKSDKHLIFVVVGIDKLIANLGPEKERFTTNVQNAVACKNCSFIVIENATNLKAHQFDSWYKGYVVTNTGIWIGNGIDTQYALTYEADRKSINGKCGISYGYVVRKGKVTPIKVLGLEEKSEENE